MNFMIQLFASKTNCSIRVTFPSSQDVAGRVWTLDVLSPKSCRKPRCQSRFGTRSFLLDLFGKFRQRNESLNSKLFALANSSFLKKILLCTLFLPVFSTSYRRFAKEIVTKLYILALDSETTPCTPRKTLKAPSGQLNIRKLPKP